MIRVNNTPNEEIAMTKAIAVARAHSPRMTASLAVLLGVTMMLGACGSARTTTTTTEESTTRQVAPAAIPTSTTTITRTQQTAP